MRIADVLMDGGDGDAAEKEMRRRSRRRRERSPIPSFQCLSPRLLLSSWLSKGKRRSLSAKSEKEERESRLDGGDEPSSTAVELGDVSEQHGKQDCVNLAVGFGLFHLVTATKNELNKMIELRREMEVLVHNTRNEFQTPNRVLMCEPSESNNNLDYSTIDARESLYSDGQFSFQNLSYDNQTETMTSYSCDKSLTINTNSHGKCVEGIDQLESELETELERLQVHLDTSDYPRNQKSKMPNDDSFSGGSSSSTFQEAVDIQDANSSREQFGVCPYELERKLHELLESRQQDKIKELEATLQRAKQKLLEREREASWWKETAKIFSHHVPRASRLSRLGQASS